MPKVRSHYFSCVVCVFLIAGSGICGVLIPIEELMLFMPALLGQGDKSSAFVILPSQSRPESLEVATQYSRLRATPDTTSALVFLAKNGHRFKIIAKQGQWFFVFIKEQKRGWIAENTAKLIYTAKSGSTATASAKNEPSAAVKTVAVSKTTGENKHVFTGGYTRVYRAASRTTPIVYLAKRGENYEVLAENDTWMEITFKGDTGWVSKTDLSPPPAAVAPSPPSGTTPQVQISQTPRQETARNQPVAVASSADSLRRSNSPPIIIHDTVRVPIAPPKTTQVPAPPPPNQLQQFFSQKSKKELMPEATVTPQNEPNPDPTFEFEQQQYLFVQIKSSSPAPIRSSLHQDSTILLMARKGEVFPLISAGDSWCKITVGPREGWIQRRNVRIVESATPSPFSTQTLFTLAIILGIAIFAAIIGIIVSRLNSRKIGWFKTTRAEKNVLIISARDKLIQQYLAGSSAPISKCFSELGFRVSQAKDMTRVSMQLTHHLPDVIMADWEIDRDIQTSMEKILSSKTSTANILIIFYNVYDPQKVRKSDKIPNAQYLGPRFTDREVFSLVTPLIIKENRPINIRKSVETAALEGEIGESSMSELLQFIDIGKKNGCLLIGGKKPIGILYFKSGNVVFAATKNEKGQPAIFAILGTKSGHFSMVLEKIAPEENCNVSAMGILMEWTRLADENHGH
jgi:SH3-like domain-containing protein